MTVDWQRSEITVNKVKVVQSRDLGVTLDSRVSRSDDV